ncbi:MAG TPA: TolC family protein [Bryobacteraceae bacterium]|nr:TolC family protein [Bryobacteraceae bacterium]
MASRLGTLAWGVVLVSGLFGQPPAGGITLTLQDALERARKVAQQYQSAVITAELAHEDRVQAKAALLPTVNWFNQYIYTQANGTPSGVFVANDGVHVYSNQAIVHGDIFAPGKRADYQRAIAAEAAARAKAEIAARGLTATIVQDYYGLLAAQRKSTNAEQSLKEAQEFVDITRKLEAGGEAAHSDTVKAEIQLAQRERDAQDARLAVERNRIGFGVLLFTDYTQEFSVEDNLATAPPVPPRAQVDELAGRNNPDIRAAQATVQQEHFEVLSARAAYLPTLSFDYFFGIDANQYAIWNRDHERNLGSAAQGTLTIPIWNWGATRSKVRQGELRLRQARMDLSLAQRQLLANLNSFYLEAQAASAQLESLRRSADLSAESLRLTLLRYQAGEVTVLEVVDAQSTLAQARNAYADGLVRNRVALAGLQTLTGEF